MKCKSCNSSVVRSFLTELEVEKIQCFNCGEVARVDKLLSYVISFISGVLIAVLGVSFSLDYFYSIVLAILFGGIVSRGLILIFGLYK